MNKMPMKPSGYWDADKQRGIVTVTVTRVGVNYDLTWVAVIIHDLEMMSTHIPSTM